MFQSGDTISHSQHGVGVILSFQQQEVMGQKLALTTLFFQREGLQMTVPQLTFEQRVRPLMDKTGAGDILVYLGDLQTSIEPVWKKRQKENQERLTSGDPHQVCAVAKSLVHLRKKGPLPASDKAQLKRSLDLLAEELSVVLGGTAQSMMGRIEQACLTSLSAV